MSEPSDQEKADISLDKLDAEADRWAEEVDLVSMIRTAASLPLLNRSAPDAIRERFIARMEAQFAAIIRQAFIEGAYRMIGHECRMCSAPVAQPGLCSDCAPRVVSAEEMATEPTDPGLIGDGLQVMGYNKAWAEAAPEIDRLRAALAASEVVRAELESRLASWSEDKLRALNLRLTDRIDELEHYRQEAHEALICVTNDKTRAEADLAAALKRIA